jgi:AraC-like DNA-binding protein
MTLELSFDSILDILSFATALMLGFLFLTVKSGNKKANIFIGLFLWSLSIEILQVLVQGFSEEQIIMPITGLFTILFLFLYVNQTINNEFKKWYLLLFIPGFIINIFNYLYLDVDIELLGFFDYIFNIFLLVFILKTIKKHKDDVSNYYSDLENKTLSWIKTIVFIFLGFHALWIIEDIVSFKNEDIIEYFAVLSTILTFFMVYWIGYNGFSQSEIFKNKLFIATEKEETIINKTDVLCEESKKAFLILKVRIETEKLFTNRELNLRNLSIILEVKEKELSKLINEHSKTNFYQFINGFRVSEFKKLVASPKAKQLSLLGLAEEAGFSSKSTFYTAFKTIEGITPKQYELSLKESE